MKSILEEVKSGNVWETSTPESSGGNSTRTNAALADDPIMIPNEMEVPTDMDVQNIEKSLEEIDEFNLENICSSIEEKHSKLKDLWKKNEKKITPEVVAKCAKEIAEAMYQDQQQSLADKQHRINMKKWKGGIKSQQKNHRERHNHDPLQLTLPSLEQSVYRGIHPDGTPAERIKEMREYYDNYTKTYSELVELIEIRKQRQGNLDNQSTNLDALDRSINNRYKQLINQRNGFVRVLRKVSTGILIVGSVVSLFNPAIGLGISAVGTGICAAGANYRKGTSAQESHWQSKVGHNFNTRERLANLSYGNRQEMFAIEQHKNTQRKILLNSELACDPTKYRELLDKEQPELKKQISNKEASLKKTENEIKALEKDIGELEQTEVKGKNAVIDTNEKKEKEAFKRRTGRLQKTQQTLTVRRQTLAALKAKQELQKREVKDLKEDDIKLNTRIRQENKLAPIKDYFFEVVSYEVDKWASADREIQKWRETIQKGLQDYKLAREVEGNLVSGAVNTINSLFGELYNSPLTQQVSQKIGLNFGWAVGKAQGTINLGNQLYQMHDKYQTWNKGRKTLYETLESLRKDNPNAGFYDAVNKMGAVHFVGSYLVPGLQIIQAGLAVYRLGHQLFVGSSGPVMSMEERRIREIGEFLDVFSKHLDERLNSIEKRIDKNQKRLMNTIGSARAELAILGNEIIDEITRSRKLIIENLDVNTYHDHTIRIKKKGQKIATNCWRLRKEAAQTSDTKQKIHALKSLMIELNAALKFKTNFEINTGINIGRGQSGQETDEIPLVTLEQAAKKPDVYTGLIATKIGFKRTAPSLFLFNEVVNQLVHLKKKYGNVIKKDPILNNEFQKAQKRALQQGQALQELVQSFPHAAELVRNRQGVIINAVKGEISRAQKLGECLTTAHINAVMNNNKHFVHLLESDSLVGVKKFHYANLLCGTKIRNTYKLIHDYEHISWVRSWFDALTANHFFNLNDIKDMGPNPKAVTMSQCSFNDKSIVDLTRVDRLETPGWDGVKIELIISIEGILNAKITELRRSFYSLDFNTTKQYYMYKWGHSLVHGKSSNVSLFTEVSGPHSLEFTETPEKMRNDPYSRPDYYLVNRDWVKAPFGMIIYMANKRYDNEDGLIPEKCVMLSKGKISIDEIKKLSKNHHLVGSNTSNNTKKLISKYLEVLSEVVSGRASDLISNETLLSEVLKEHGKAIPSANPGLIPLVFPKTLFAFLESQIAKEKAEIEASGAGVLIPSYQLKYSEDKKSYKLQIDYTFSEKDNSMKQTLFARFNIASFDERTVNAFTQPTFDVKKPINKPNINEFLLQAMYGSYYGLGMPDEKTTTLGKGKWVAPSMLRFLGVFKLCQNNPEMVYHFDSKKYSYEISEKLSDLIQRRLVDVSELRGFAEKRSSPKFSGSYMEIWRKVREGLREQEKKRDELSKNYDLIWAFCCLVSGLDDHSLRSELLMDLGMLPPGQFNSLWDMLAKNVEPKKFTPQDIKNLKRILTTIPSGYVRELNTIMTELNDKDVKNKGKASSSK